MHTNQKRPIGDKAGRPTRTAIPDCDSETIPIFDRILPRRPRPMRTPLAAVRSRRLLACAGAVFLKPSRFKFRFCQFPIIGSIRRGMRSEFQYSRVPAFYGHLNEAGQPSGSYLQGMQPADGVPCDTPRNCKLARCICVSLLAVSESRQDCFPVVIVRATAPSAAREGRNTGRRGRERANSLHLAHQAPNRTSAAVVPKLTEVWYLGTSL